MHRSKNLEAAKRWFHEVWNLKTDEIVHEMLAPDAVAHLEPSDVIGIPEFLAQRAIIFTLLPKLKVHIDSMLAQGDEVAVRWTASGDHLGAALGIMPTDKKVSFRGVTWLVFKNGKIVEGWDCWNQGRFLQGLQNPDLK